MTDYSIGQWQGTYDRLPCVLRKQSLFLKIIRVVSSVTLEVQAQSGCPCHTSSDVRPSPNTVFTFRDSNPLGGENIIRTRKRTSLCNGIVTSNERRLCWDSLPTLHFTPVPERRNRMSRSTHPRPLSVSSRRVVRIGSFLQSRDIGKGRTSDEIQTCVHDPTPQEYRLTDDFDSKRK